MHPWHAATIGVLILIGGACTLLSLFVQPGLAPTAAPAAAQIQCAGPQAGSHWLADAPLDPGAGRACDVSSARAGGK